MKSIDPCLKTVIGQPRWLVSVQDLGLLALRCWLAYIFFRSGLTKIQSWDSTLALFANEYSVPLLSPTLAAWMGTATELLLPPLLALGFTTRLPALALFIFNLVAAASYPDLSEAGMKDHFYWGILFVVLIVQGGGRLSLDYLWLRRLLEKRQSGF